MLHSFAASIAGIPLPEKFTYPFCYTPHPLCILAARETQAYLCAQAQWQDELQTGKMFGVLVVQTSGGHIGYLAAFSGLLAGKSHIPFFVPPVYDLQQPDGFFKKEEKLISQLNARIDRLEQSDTYRHTRQTLHDSERAADQVLTDAKLRMKQAKAERDALRTRGNTDAETERRLTRESQFQKAEYRRQKQALENHIALLRQQMSAQEGLIEQLKTERKERSAALQRRIFEHFDLLNANGEHRNLCQIFAPTVHRTPPRRSRGMRRSKTAATSLSARMEAPVHGRVLVGRLPQKRTTPTRALLPGLQRKVWPDTVLHATGTRRGR